MVASFAINGGENRHDLRQPTNNASAGLGRVECGTCQSVSDVGLALSDAKPILGRLQQVVTTGQLRGYYETARVCPETGLRGLVGTWFGIHLVRSFFLRLQRRKSEIRTWAFR